MTSNLSLARSIMWMTSVLLAGVLLGATISFLIDQDRCGPEGFTHGFSISEIPSSVSRDEVVSTIREAAGDEHVNVYKMSPSAQESVRSTDYYVFIGEETLVIGDLDQGAFPTFGTQFPATLQPAAALTRDRLLGTYLVQGDAQQAQGIVSSLERLGIRAPQTSSPPSSLLWGIFLVGSPWGIAVLILLSALVLAAANLASVRLAIAGLRLTTGMPLSRIRAAEGCALLIPVTVCVALSSFALLAYSLINLNGYQARTILVIGAQQLVIVLIAAASAMGLVALSVRNHSIGRIIKGDRPMRLLTVLSATAIVIATAGAGGNTAGTINQITEFRQAQPADSFRAANPELVKPVFSYAIATEEASEIFPKLGEIFRTMEQQDSVLLTEAGILSSFIGEQHAIDPQRSLLINSAFLRTLPSVDPELKEAVDSRAGQLGAVTLVIPADLSEHKDAIRSSLDQWLNFQLSLNEDAPDQARPNTTVLTGVDLGIVPRLDYDATGSSMHLVDPITVIIDADNGLLSDDFYGDVGAYADQDKYKQLVDYAGVGHAVVALESIAELSALDHANRLAELRITITGTIVMLLVLMLGSIIFAAVYHARKATAIFLLASTGSGFFNIYGRFLALVGVLSAIPAFLASAVVKISVLPQVAIVAIITAIALATTSAMLLALKRSLTRTALEVT
ncbi:MAG: hypothetical protein GX562_03185 [Coriobacteriaceae bacterium]|nr:hypothetical protein [Coriobacteriaceae bacterium]